LRVLPLVMSCRTDTILEVKTRQQAMGGAWCHVSILVSCCLGSSCPPHAEGIQREGYDVLHQHGGRAKLYRLSDGIMEPWGTAVRASASSRCRLACRLLQRCRKMFPSEQDDREQNVGTKQSEKTDRKQNERCDAEAGPQQHDTQRRDQ
jgi:hypothetical protein